MKALAISEGERVAAGPSRVLAWLPALLLFLLCFPGYWLLSLQFHELGVFQQYNILFDADPNARLECFSTGWGGGGRSVAHPNLCNLINPPIRVLALLLKASGLAGIGIEQQLALLIAPLAAAASLGLLYASLILLGCQPAYAFALALLAGVSFSQLIFGSIPDHFVLGGLSLSLTAWLLIRSIRLRRLHFLPWGLAGALVASITITNFVLFLLALAASCVALPDRVQALRRAALIIVLATATLLAIKFPLDAGYREGEDFAQARDFAMNYMQTEPLKRLAEFPFITVASFVAPSSKQIPQRLEEENQRYGFEFTLAGGRYDSALSITAAGAVSFLFLAGLWQGCRRVWGGDAVDHAVLILAVGTLGFNALFHAGWGGEYFLYSQHWQFASCLLLGLLGRAAHSRLLLVASALTVGLVLINNISAVAELLHQLQLSSRL